MYLRLIETLIKKNMQYSIFTCSYKNSEKEIDNEKNIAFEHLQVLVIVAFQETLHSHIRVVLTCNLYVSVAAEL